MKEWRGEEEAKHEGLRSCCRVAIEERRKGAEQCWSTSYLSHYPEGSSLSPFAGDFEASQTAR